MPKRRKNASSLNALNQLCPRQARQVPQAQVREPLQVRQVHQGGVAAATSAAESPDKYNIKVRWESAATATSTAGGGRLRQAVSPVL